MYILAVVGLTECTHQFRIIATPASPVPATRRRCASYRCRRMRERVYRHNGRAMLDNLHFAL